MDFFDLIRKKFDEKPAHYRFKVKFAVWWSMRISNRLAWFRIWLHRKKLKKDTCENCKHFIPFVIYVDKGDCMHEEIWDIVKVWHKCPKFKIK